MTLEVLLSLERLGAVGIIALLPPRRDVAHLDGAAVKDGAVLVDLDRPELSQCLHIVLVLLEGERLALDFGEELASGVLAIRGSRGGRLEGRGGVGGLALDVAAGHGVERGG